MDYKLIEREKVARPKSSFKGYKQDVATAIESFTRENKIISALEKGSFNIEGYHGLLKTIFHQVYFSSTSFGLAGSLLSAASVSARSYLLHHAEEEKDHWIWILEDLQSTGYAGIDPRASFPNSAAQAYLSYGVFLSLFNPLGRLAMANVLEGISGKFGVMYGARAIEVLKLKKDQAKFFLMHGELDMGHTADIEEVLQSENLSEEQWAEMGHVAQMTSQMYKNLYNSVYETDLNRA